MWVGESVILILFLYFTSILVLSLFKPNYIQDRKVYLFRCIFPSWKFYEDLSYEPILYFRFSQDGINFEEWRPAISKISRSWKKIFINPEGNLLHAYNSLLLQVESDKEDFTGEVSNDFSNSVSYQLVKNLVEFLTREKILNGQYFQFKLTSTKQGNPTDFEDTLISLVHRVSN